VRRGGRQRAAPLRLLWLPVCDLRQRGIA
jgi:hypothetical protein